MSLNDIHSIESIDPERWRNGGGNTRTLASGGTHWRVSLATIERNGPYSRFPGKARMSLILGGNGVVLRSADAIVRLLPSAAEAYDGDADWNATLIDGPAVALNVISTKGRYRVSVRRIAKPVIVHPGCATIVVALDGGCSFNCSDGHRRGEVPPGSVLVSDHHSLPLRLSPLSATVEEMERNLYAALVTLEPALV